MHLEAAASTEEFKAKSQRPLGSYLGLFLAAKSGLVISTWHENELVTMHLDVISILPRRELTVFEGCQTVRPPLTGDPELQSVVFVGLTVRPTNGRT